MNVRPLELADVDSYLRLVVAVDTGSGVDGEAHSHHSKSEPPEMDEARDRELTRWSTDIDDPAWRHGFEVLGRTPDRFRVDGDSLDDTWMTLNVSSNAD